jgi:hypothetical protein
VISTSLLAPFVARRDAEGRSTFIIGDKVLHEIKPSTALPMWIRFEELASLPDPRERGPKQRLNHRPLVREGDKHDCNRSHQQDA